MLFHRGKKRIIPQLPTIKKEDVIRGDNLYNMARIGRKNYTIKQDDLVPLYYYAWSGHDFAQKNLKVMLKAKGSVLDPSITDKTSRIIRTCFDDLFDIEKHLDEVRNGLTAYKYAPEYDMISDPMSDEDFAYLLCVDNALKWRLHSDDYAPYTVVRGMRTRFLGCVKK